MKKLAIINQKGGVAKTTSAISIASGIAMLKPKSRVLLVEADAQGNFKTYFKIKHVDAQISFGDLLVGGKANFAPSDLNQVPVGPLTSKLTLDVMMAGPTLKNADIKMAAFTARESVLKVRLKETTPHWDYVIFDCAPAINVPNQNVIAACDYVLIPSTMDAFSGTGVQATTTFIEDIEKSLEKKVTILGILPTIFDKRIAQSSMYLEAIKDYGLRVLKPIPVDRRVRSAINNARTVHRYEDSPASVAYLNTCEELLKKMDGKKAPKPISRMNHEEASL